ncbi:MAG: MMPL family transporter [Dermatophilaceae bacterium]
MTRGRHRAVPDRRLVRLGRLTARHPWRFVVAWALLTVAAFAVAVGGVTGESLFGRLSSGNLVVPGEAENARQIMQAAGPQAQTVMFEASNADMRSPAVAKAATESAAKISAIDGVATSVNPFVFPAGLSDPRAAALLGDQDRDSGRFLVVTTLDSNLDDDAAERVEAQVVQAYGALGDTLGGATGAVGSGQLLFSEITDQIEVDLRTGEGIALPLSFALMVVVFGGFIAAGMPIAGAIASIGGGLAALYAFTYAIDLDASVVNVVTLLGLALCIDYGLLVVSRAREELRAIAQGRPAKELTDDEMETAIGRTVGTAGRTVLFSGLTVAISLGGLLVFQSQIMRAIGAAGMSVVLIALLVGLSLVPSLGKLGAHRLLRKGTEVAPDEGVFSRLAERVQRRPWAVASASVAVLVLLALPTLSMRLTSSGHELLPVGSSQRDFFDVLAEHYPALSDPAATVVAETSPEAATTWADSTVRDIAHVTSTSVRQLDPTHVAVSVRTDGQPLDDGARAVVDQLRSSRPSFPTLVGGQAAALADFVDALWARAPYAIAAVVIATFVLMFLMTGSVVLPVKALIINVLSLGASLGIATWVFQNGHFESLLGFTSTGALESMIPPLVLAFGFGLSMDYELFLLSRVAELYHAGVPNQRAVVLGLQRSGRIITSAALLVVIVFAGFAAGKMLIIKQTGLALAVAVLLDATIVRMLLVPATMTILGHWNWWAPAPLRRWHAAHALTE